MINYQKVIQDLFEKSLEIKNEIFHQTVFNNKEIEELYQKEYSKNCYFQKMISEIMLASGYIASLLYIILAFQKIYFLRICLGFLLLNMILLGFSTIIKNKKFKYYISIFQIFLLSLNMNLKINLLCFVFNDEKNDNYNEIIRVIIYDFISANLFLMLKIEANIYISLGFNAMNIFSCINSYIHSNENHFYHLDMIIGFCLTITFFVFRKAWDYRLRVIFSEKYKSDKLILHTFEFINCLNGYHLNIRDDKALFYDEKFSNLLKNIIGNKENKSNFNQSHIKQENIKPEIFNQNLFSLDGNNMIICFLKKLKLYKGENEEELNNENFQNIEEKLFSKNILKDNENNFNYNSENSKLNVNLNESKNYNNTNNKNNSSSINLNTEKNNIMSLNEKEINLFEKINYIQKMKKAINYSNRENYQTFKNLGIYYIKDISESYRYFDIYLRYIEFSKSTTLNDVLFYDITDLINSKKNLLHHVSHMQKILTKVTKEFKIPINSIIGIISNLRGSKYKNLKDNEKEKYLEVIDNLSNYIIVQISDLITFSNPLDIQNIRFRNDRLDLENLFGFCFDILNSILKCNSNKIDKIKTVLEIDEKIHGKKILSDEFRLKQIILNLISNAVKFTNYGKITLKCELKKTRNFIVIKVIDTGKGIKEDDKAKLLKIFDFISNTSNELEFFKNGLGLPICSILAKKLNVIIKFKSEVGFGSEFKIFVPFSEDKEKVKCNENRNIILRIPETNKITQNFKIYSQNNLNRYHLEEIKVNFSN